MSDRHDWHSLYLEAMLEPDPDNLRQRITRAQEAIAERLESGINGESELGIEERAALSDAQHNLRALLRSARPNRTADTF